MKKVIYFLFASLALAGCSSEGPGDLPPPTKPMTQAEIDSMPPEARASMENAMRQGQDAQANRGINGAK